MQSAHGASPASRTSSPMRILFMGTPEFAVASLARLLEHGYDVPAVVTVPDKPSGRGLKHAASAVKQFACSHGLAVLQPSNLRDPAFVAEVKNFNPDLIVVVAFRILPPEVFTTPRFGSINLHASLLPKYRGAAPIQWAIINGEKETGVTTFFLRETVDTGNIILQARLPIREDETAGELHDRLAEVGAEIVLHTVRLIETGKASPRPQDDASATPAPKIFKEDCRIDWKKSAVQVHNFVRGLSPIPGAFTHHRGEQIKLFRGHPSDEAGRKHPGEILRADDRLIVDAGEGAYEILELQQSGHRRMSAAEFLRGRALAAGDHFE